MLRCGYSFHSTLPKKLCDLRLEYGAFGNGFGFLMLPFEWPNTVPKNGWDFFFGMEEVYSRQYIPFFSVEYFAQASPPNHGRSERF